MLQLRKAKMFVIPLPNLRKMPYHILELVRRGQRSQVLVLLWSVLLVSSVSAHRSGSDSEKKKHKKDHDL